MLSNEWPYGNSDKEYDTIMGAPEAIWVDEEIDDPTWNEGCKDIIKKITDHNYGQLITWSYTPTRTDGLSDDTVEGSRTA